MKQKEMLTHALFTVSPLPALKSPNCSLDQLRAGGWKSSHWLVQSFGKPGMFTKSRVWGMFSEFRGCFLNSQALSLPPASLFECVAKLL